MRNAITAIQKKKHIFKLTFVQLEKNTLKEVACKQNDHPLVIQDQVQDHHLDPSEAKNCLYKKALLVNQVANVSIFLQ